MTRWFFTSADERTHDDLLDEHDDSKGRLIVKSIEEWEAAGFPGTWDDWWNRWWDKHVAEHKEWLVWLHSSYAPSMLLRTHSIGLILTSRQIRYLQ
jgi:hypothetical protein